MRKSKIESMFKLLENEGLFIKGIHNNNPKFVIATTENAKLYKKHFMVKDYILGMVNSSTENLENLDYHIVFDSLESHFGMYDISSSIQKKLHKLNEEILLDTGADSIEFINAVKEMKEIDADFKNRIFNTINEGWKKDIVEELKEMLDDVRGIHLLI